MRSSVIMVITMVIPVTSIAQDPPPKPWNSSLGAGLAVTSGNSETQNLNFSYGTVYDPKTVRIFKANALYLLGESDGEKQVDKTTANAVE